MLRMPKILIGSALVAAVLAGCQTMQKTDYASNDLYSGEVDFDSAFPGYNYGTVAGRGIASVTPILRDFLKALEPAVRVGTQMKPGRQVFEGFLNSSQHQALRDLREAKFKELQKAKPSLTRDQVRLEIKDLDNLTAYKQGEVALAFLKQNDAKNLKNLQKTRAGIEEQMARVGRVDSDLAARGNTKALLSEIDAKSGLTAKQKSEMKAVNVWLKDFEKQLLEQLGPEGKARGKEIRAKINHLMWVSGDIFDLSGVANFTRETCANLSPEALDAYIRELDGMADAMKKYASKETVEIRVKDPATGQEKLVKRERWNRAPCTNHGEIMAQAAIRFQETLGRKGLAAGSAVVEQGACHHVGKPVTDGAKRILASQATDEVGCKR